MRVFLPLALACACIDPPAAPIEDAATFEPDAAGEADGGAPDAAIPDAAIGSDDAGIDPARCPDPPAMLPSITPEQNGRFSLFRSVPGDGLLPRDVTVLVPEAYQSDPERRFPVLYMHDGQNIFEASRASFGVEWQVDETLDRLTRDGAVPPYIVVGVDNTAERTSDYTPDFDPEFGAGGNGAAYADFLAGVVKPLIDREFRTRCVREETAVAGSSLGGLISIYIGLRHPDLFGRIGAVSPAVFWNDGSILTAFSAFAGPLPHRLWIDAGSAESDRGNDLLDVWIQGVRDARDVALAKGMVYGRDLLTLEDFGAAHFEADWAARLGSIFTFLLGDAVDVSTPDSIALYSYGDVLNLEGPIVRVATTVEGRRGELRATVLPAAVTFESSDPAIATIDVSGIVEARAAGTAQISADLGGRRASTSIAVTDVPMASIVFSVRVPATTPATSFVHVAGNAAALGSWDPAGVALTPAGPDRWSATIAFPVGANLEFKFTRGTWETVERDASGADIPNRTFVVSGDAMLDLSVDRWADQ